MKRLVLILVAGIVAVLVPIQLAGQEFTAQEGELNGCRASVMAARLDLPAKYVPVAGRREGKPALQFEVRSFADRPVTGMDLVAVIRVKTDRYQLDSVTREVPIHLRGTGLWGGDGKQMRQEYPLREGVVGLVRLDIREMWFADGGMWRPTAQHACGYLNPGSEEIGK